VSLARPPNLGGTRSDLTLDATDRAISEFRGMPRLDAHLRKRLLSTTAPRRAAHRASLPQRFSWPELEAADRLIDRADRPDDPQAVHFE
jgi:hypothetical protein